MDKNNLMRVSPSGVELTVPVHRPVWEDDPKPGIHPRKPAPEDDPGKKKKRNPYEITC